MEPDRMILILVLSLLCNSHAFDLFPIPCNVSLTDSCPALLYYVPNQPMSTQEASDLFSVASNLVTKTIDGFLIDISCSCPADHKEYIWHAGYTIQSADTWMEITEKFGLLVKGRPAKKLIPGMNVMLDVLCGCLEGGKILTYTIQPGDTLFKISALFKADMGHITTLNKIADQSLIHAGDNIFIPVSDLSHLTILGENDSNKKASSRHRSRSILGITIPAVVILVTAVLLFLIYHKRKEKDRPSVVLGGRTNSRFSSAFHMGSELDSRCSYEASERSTTSSMSVNTTIFSYSEVCNATSKFSASHKIGQGSFGCVYRGRLREEDVAVKQMKNTKSKEFFAELNILCNVYHNNLIKLLGYSAGAESLFLVYEFAQNGALSEHLHDPAIKGHKPLSWSKRVQIALDIAKGLEYIHVYIKPFCVHRDVKTSNILLDSNFRAKIADFGLVKLLEQSSADEIAASKLVGTFGYLAPEYVREGCVTPKSDVYAYGVVLMELITGQPALSRNQSLGDKAVEHRTVVDYMLSALEVCHDSVAQLAEIVDPKLLDYHESSLIQMALLSKDCVDDDWIRRPNMSHVVLRLSQIVQTMEQVEVVLFPPFPEW